MLDFTEMQRSTGRASKLRRDQINSEIETLRQLLPLPSTVKARLSYLQVMSLACVYIRTGNFFASYTKAEITRSLGQTSTLAPVEITQALPGFLLLVRPSGKILHVSENVIDHLGHSMVEVLSGGGDVYDLVDEVDHVTLRTHLHAGDRNARRSSRHSFVCQMIMSRSLRRGMPFQGTECKAFHIDGRFHYSEGECKSGGEGVFLALCTPVDTSMDSTSYYSDRIRSAIAGFTTKHTLDMRIVDSCNRSSLLLGYSSEELFGLPWYHLIRPEYIFIAKNFHQRILAMTGISDTQCSSTLQLVTKDNQMLTTQITARLTRESSGPGLYTISCQYRIIRGDIETDHRFQTTSPADQRVTDSRNHHHSAGPWPDYRHEGAGKEDMEEGSHYTSPVEQGYYNNEQPQCPLSTGMLGGLPQPRYVSPSMDSGCHKNQKPHGQASAPIRHIKSEMPEDLSTREPCQHRNGQPGVDAQSIPSSPSYAEEKTKIKKCRIAREHHYPSMVPGQTMDYGNQYGGYLGRLQGTLDLTCVFGRQDTYRAHGTICLLSSRCSLTELRQRHDGGAVISNNTTETEEGRPFCRRRRHSSVASDASNDVFDTIRSPRTYDTHPSCHWQYDEPRISPTSDSSSQSAESTDLRLLTMGLDNNSITRKTTSSLWSSKGFSSNHALQRQRNRSAGDVSPVEFTFPTGESGRRYERYQSRPGSFGMRSVEESVTAALKCLSNDQIKLLDQATWELSKTGPC